MSANAPVAAQPDPNQKKSGSKWMIGCLIAGGVFLCLIVPIMGVIAAIAIPNFMKFKCKSMQTEAKMNLRSLQIAEQIFYGEHSYYTSDLKALEFHPSAGGTTHYLYGFADAGPGNLRKSEEPADYDESRQTSADLGIKATDKHGSPLTADDLPSDTLVDREHFVAGAVGDVGGSSGLLDIWTIDEKGSPKNTFNACGGPSDY